MISAYIYMNNWWLVLNKGDPIWYWPPVLFSGFDLVTHVRFGEYLSCQRGQDCLPTGNVHFPTEDMPWACFMNNVRPCVEVSSGAASISIFHMLVPRRAMTSASMMPCSCVSPLVVRCAPYLSNQVLWE